MEITKQERDELCEKSKLVFGSKWRWKKMVENGTQIPVGNNTKMTIPVTLDQVKDILNVAIEQREQAERGDETRSGETGSDTDAPTGDGTDK